MEWRRIERIEQLLRLPSLISMLASGSGLSSMTVTGIARLAPCLALRILPLFWTPSLAWCFELDSDALRSRIGAPQRQIKSQDIYPGLRRSRGCDR
jgi:hypothetical protein